MIFLGGREGAKVDKKFLQKSKYKIFFFGCGGGGWGGGMGG